MLTIEERLNTHGFYRDLRGNGVIEYERQDETGEIVEVIALTYPDAGWRMDAPVEVTTYCNTSEDDPMQGTGGIVDRYTLADVLRVLDDPRDEYALLDLRLYNYVKMGS